MSEIKRPWTPGPWEYRPDDFDDWGVVRHGRYHLCKARDPRVSFEDLPKYRASKTDPYEANARLISAAPELAEAAVPFAHYLKMRAACQLRGLGDAIHVIHPGTDFEASITMQHIEALVSALRKAGMEGV